MALDEKKVAAASYILNFYKQIHQLTSLCSQYNNVILELEERYKSLDIAKVEEHERNTVRAAVQLVREAVHRSYIQFHTINKVLKVKNKTDVKVIEDIYKKIKVTFMIERDDLEKYVLKINEILVNNVIQSLLSSSQEIITEVYGDEEKEEEEDKK